MHTRIASETHEALSFTRCSHLGTHNTLQGPGSRTNTERYKIHLSAWRLAPGKNGFLNSQFRALLNLIFSQGSHGLTPGIPKVVSRWEMELSVPQADEVREGAGMECEAQPLALHSSWEGGFAS